MYNSLTTAFVAVDFMESLALPPSRVILGKHSLEEGDCGGVERVGWLV